MNYYFKLIKHYADFKGRAGRKEYWMFMLFNILFFKLTILMDFLLGTSIDKLSFGGLFFLAYSLFIFIPGLAFTVRRLHDVGKSGWFLLIGFIPVIGTIWVLKLIISDSEQVENTYGLNPKLQYISN